MRITGLQSYHVNGGWRPFSFLKITTDETLSGWAEYSLGPWAPALAQVIEALGQHVIGRDPRSFNLLRRELAALTRFAAGGLNCQAAAAIENACIDIAAKAAGMSVANLFGGGLREEIPLYWTHCGSFRAREPGFFESVLGRERLIDLESVQRLGREVADRGFRAAKTNPVVFGASGATLLNPGFVPNGLDHGGTLEAETLFAIVDQVEAFRDGAGPTIDLMLDVNFAYSPESVKRLDRELWRHRLRWLEYDNASPAALGELRDCMTAPLASLESVHECAAYKQFLDAGSADIVVIDLLWNGFGEGLRIANLCAAYSLNTAPHNFYGPLADLMSAQFCSLLPNLEIMEFEGDDVPWKYDLLTAPPTILNGRIAVPTSIGWGADLDEEALRAHPWKPGC